MSLDQEKIVQSYRQKEIDDLTLKIEGLVKKMKEAPGEQRLDIIDLLIIDTTKYYNLTKKYYQVGDGK